MNVDIFQKILLMDLQEYCKEAIIKHFANGYKEIGTTEFSHGGLIPRSHEVLIIWQVERSTNCLPGYNNLPSNS